MRGISKILATVYLVFFIIFLYFLTILISQALQIQYMKKIDITALPLKYRTATAILSAKTNCSLSLLESIIAYENLKENNNPYNITYKKCIEDFLKRLEERGVRVRIEYKSITLGDCDSSPIFYELFGKYLTISICANLI